MLKLAGMTISSDFRLYCLPCLSMNLNIKNIYELKGYLLKKTEKFDFDRLAKDIEPLLFNPDDKKRVVLFRDFIEKGF